ncbi:hypothetical protein GCM10025859_58270 [Alicyclobacillus fastidiosus]|nr:hypothetical protein GCM10025859_58270 [Alicyclobacillus fastidiosus]
MPWLQPRRRENNGVTKFSFLTSAQDPRKPFKDVDVAGYLHFTGMIAALIWGWRKKLYWLKYSMVKIKFLSGGSNPWQVHQKRYRELIKLSAGADGGRWRQSC